MRELGTSTVAEIVKDNLIRKPGIDPDVLNSGWNVLGGMVKEEDSRFHHWDLLGPATEYEAHVHASGYSPEDAEEIIRLSDPSRVAAYNQLVREWNEQVESIKETRDINRARIFWGRAEQIIRGS